MRTDQLKYAVCCLEPAHESPLLNSLKAAAIERGLLMNFGNEPMFKRLVYNKQCKQSVLSVLICG
jgi:hypothetical protein